VIQDKIAKLMQYEYHVEQQWPE